VNANGSIRRIDHRDIILNLFLGARSKAAQRTSTLRRHGTAIESVPLFGPRSPAVIFVDDGGRPGCTIAARAKGISRVRLLRLVRGAPWSRILARRPGVRHGDWNDSLQPLDPAMCERLCSAWTVTLHHHTLTTLAKALRCIGRVAPAGILEASARHVKEDFHRVLIVDGTIPGYAYFPHDGPTELLLHPRDAATGISYSLLPMIHAIIDDLLTPEQAAAHVLGSWK
jgi:hypothetical protein